MFTKPSLDLGTLLVAVCIFIGLLVSGTLLGSCTTAKPATYTTQVGDHHHSHDARTKLNEPEPSRIK